MVPWQRRLQKTGRVSSRTAIAKLPKCEQPWSNLGARMADNHFGPVETPKQDGEVKQMNVRWNGSFEGSGCGRWGWYCNCKLGAFTEGGRVPQQLGSLAATSSQSSLLALLDKQRIGAVDTSGYEGQSTSGQCAQVTKALATTSWRWSILPLPETRPEW